MTNSIHPTAIIHKDAQLGNNNYVGPFCLIGPDVVIGNNNHFESHVVIGSPAQKHGYWYKPGPVRIANNNTIREFCAIQAGTLRSTEIHNRCFLMQNAHVSHDSCLEDDVILTVNVALGGETIIGRGANLGLGVVTHQRSMIGAWSMIGMNSTITKNCHVKPGEVWIGNPAIFLKMNKIGLKRFGVTSGQLKEARQSYDDHNGSV